MTEHLIVIPAVNEAGTIAAVVAAARRHGPVLVVDDGSTDGTPEEARGAGAEVLELGRRRGKGAAIRAGVEIARRRGTARIITLDGDGQHDPGDIPLLTAAVRRTPGAIVIGDRLRDAAGMPRGRWNACRVAGFFIDWITDVPIRDTQSGFRSYPVPLFDQVSRRHGGFVLETALLVAGARAGRPIVEVDVRTAHRPSRPSRFHPLADGGAIAAYLAVRVAGRCVREIGAGGREVAAVFDRARLRARHAEMAEAGAHYPDAPPLWGVAVAGVAARRAHARLRSWWRHPRRRRFSLVLRAIAMSPVMLGLAALQPLLTGLRADPVTPFVDRFYSQDRLARAGHGGAPFPVATATESPVRAGSGAQSPALRSVSTFKRLGSVDPGAPPRDRNGLADAVRLERPAAPRTTTGSRLE